MIIEYNLKLKILYPKYIKTKFDTIKFKKKSRIFAVVGNAYFLVEAYLLLVAAFK